MNRMYNSSLVSIRDLEKVESNINDIRVNTLLMLFKRVKAEMPGQLDLIDKLTKQNDDLIKEYEKSLDSRKDAPGISEEVNNHKEFMVALAEYREARTQVINLVKDGKFDEAVESNKNRLSPSKDAVMGKLAAAIKMNQEGAEALLEDSNANYGSMKMYILIGVLIVLVFAIASGFVLYECIVKPLRKINEYSNRLANYDFSTPIEVTRTDEFGQVGNSLNTAQENLREIVKAISDNSHNLTI